MLALAEILLGISADLGMIREAVVPLGRHQGQIATATEDAGRVREALWRASAHRMTPLHGNFSPGCLLAVFGQLGPVDVAARFTGCACGGCGSGRAKRSRLC